MFSSLQFDEAVTCATKITNDEMYENRGHHLGLPSLLSRKFFEIDNGCKDNIC